MPGASDTPRKHLLWAARLLSPSELQQRQPERAAAVGLLHMYLCRLFPAQTLGVKADALNPLEASAFVPPRQRKASNSKYSAVRPERSDRRHAGHLPRSSPNLVLVAVTLCSGRQAIPQQPPAAPGRQQTLHHPLQIPRSSTAPLAGAPPRVGWPEVWPCAWRPRPGGRGTREQHRWCGEPSSVPQVRHAGLPVLAQRCAGPGAAPSPAGTTGRAQPLRPASGSAAPSQPANVTGKHGWKHATINRREGDTIALLLVLKAHCSHVLVGDANAHSFSAGSHPPQAAEKPRQELSGKERPAGVRKGRSSEQESLHQGLGVRPDTPSPLSWQSSQAPATQPGC